MKFLIAPSTLGFIITQLFVIVFFILPEPLQKPFRVLLGFSFLYLYVTFLLRKKISYWTLLLLGLLLFAVMLVIRNGSMQSSLVNVVLCTFGVLCIKNCFFDWNSRWKRIADKVYWTAFIALILQVLFFRSSDGRFNLSYEINHSAAYVFLFFLYSDVLNKKYGKWLAIFLSLLLLSRLLIFSIILFYIVRFFKFLILRGHFKLNLSFVLLATYTIFFLFNLWFLLNVEIANSYDTSPTRITSVNDGSNKLRFTANVDVLSGIFSGNEKFKYGYGDISDKNNLIYFEDYVVMPHNELLVSIAEFGYVLTFIFMLISQPVLNRQFTYQALEFVIPILFFTLILWVRFLIIPSFEMIFIILILYLQNRKKVFYENSISN